MTTEPADRDSDARPDRSASAYAEAVVQEIYLIRRLYQAHLSRAYSDANREMVYMAGRILDFVARRPGCAQSEIAAHFDRDKGQIAKIVASLRNQDLVGMEVVETDRRRQRIVLTAKGERIRAQAEQEREHVARQGVRNLDETDQRTLLDLLNRMRTNLEAESY